MTTRTNHETVNFLHPFRLSAVDDVLPAGSYLVETDEELLQDVSFPAYRRLSTIIHLAGAPKSGERARVIAVDPAELAAALATDGQVQEAPATPSSRPASVDRVRGVRGLMLEVLRRLFAPRWR